MFIYLTVNILPMVPPSPDEADVVLAPPSVSVCALVAAPNVPKI